MDKNSTRSIMNKDRIIYLDIARALTIFCVILGHIVDSSTSTKSLLYAFHMPAFFFLSGIFCKDNVESVDEIKRFIGDVFIASFPLRTYCTFAMEQEKP